MSFLLWSGVTLLTLGVAVFVYIGAINLLTPKSTPRHSAEHPPEQVPRWYHPSWIDVGYADIRWAQWVATTTRLQMEPANRFIARVRRQQYIRERLAEVRQRREERLARQAALSDWRWTTASVREIREAFPCLP